MAVMARKADLSTAEESEGCREPQRDPLKPSVDVLVKLGSAIRHADEAMSENGVALDESIFRSLLAMPEVANWMDSMDEAALLPEKRDA